ncbi:unnamed protein product [Rotaria socialis]|uniref:F-box domain-containing protein n=4 Tax=Rotaria socialis TaxID=392032 RepID=A0A820ZYD7_9BILA|nr:unnamed protein product [Rotaria socialis]CAF3532450.1 unnamed protein product [Rotaria socialis]CAF3721272.1 unnamed protein product [Rotaria socialis]CAF4570105.1 unnamed protein product [Rotaria socialis]CAF4881429.1 unnamed protein product [Rotaria socialis]
MNRSNVHLLDLPNEMLFGIVKKLDNVDVLYSLFGINNERIDSIAREEIFSNTLNFASTIGDITVLDSMLDRFCNYILPRIHYNVKCLIVEPTYMERILLATHYPKLTELKIFNFQRDSSLHYLTGYVSLLFNLDDSSLRHIFRQQIKKLDLINKDRERAVGSWEEYTKRVYAPILTCFENLKHLNVVERSIPVYPGLSLRYLPSSTFSSSTLTYLCINVITWTDCLCLLDGRLKQLSTLIVKIYRMDTDSSIDHNLNDLPNLKIFSLIHYGLIEEYDNKIVSLVRRMSYLEKLTLYLRVSCKRVFIDPIYLINEFSMDMQRLRSFNFYLSTYNDRNDLVRYLSNNHIEQNYITTVYHEVSNIVCFSVDTATYHVFTLPFEFTKLIFIGNIFPNIIFNYVIELWVHDVVPFKHEFFQRIAQAFPLLERFCLSDFSPTSFAANISSDNIQSHEIVEYPHLTSLDLTRVGNNDIDQFLNESKAHLPHLAELRIFYEDLRIVTNDFTREATRRNCANVTQLITGTQIVGSKDYHIYFPLL